MEINNEFKPRLNQGESTEVVGIVDPRGAVSSKLHGNQHSTFLFRLQHWRRLDGPIEEGEITIRQSVPDDILKQLQGLINAYSIVKLKIKFVERVDDVQQALLLGTPERQSGDNELEARSKKAHEIRNRLLNDRVVLIGGQIDDWLGMEIISQMLFLQAQDRKEPISLYVLSPGGAMNPCLAVIDTMTTLVPLVDTYAVGKLTGMACSIVAHGKPGHRFAVPSAQFNLVECWGGDPEMRTELNQTMASILATDTRQTKERILADFKAEITLNAKEARKYGLVDEVLTS